MTSVLTTSSDISEETSNERGRLQTYINKRKQVIYFCICVVNIELLFSEFILEYKTSFTSSNMAGRIRLNTTLCRDLIWNSSLSWNTDNPNLTDCGQVFVFGRIDLVFWTTTFEMTPHIRLFLLVCWSVRHNFPIGRGVTIQCLS